jgi:hypothetical protein
MLAPAVHFYLVPDISPIDRRFILTGAGISAESGIQRFETQAVSAGHGARAEN